MVFSWYSEKFNEWLDKNKLFENSVAKGFGESKVVFWKAKGGNKEVDVRETLRPLGMTEPMLKGLLTKAGVKTSDDMDLKVEKIRDFVNANISYEYDEKNYFVPDYWADPWTVWDKKKDDCDGYAILIMTLMRLAGVPAWRRRIVISMTYTGELHAYVAYFTYKNNFWCVVEGSFYADNAKMVFNIVPLQFNLFYKDVWFCFNEEKAWSKSKEVFANKLVEALNVKGKHGKTRRKSR